MKSFEVQEPLQKSIEGFAQSNPFLAVVPEDRVFYRAGDKSQVALISGGGAGHEPAHAGFIGKGMLTGAVVGDIFASPSTRQILHGIKLIAKDSNGILLILMNYTGDVLHFGLSAERARALGIDCRVIAVGDDVAVGREKGGKVGRRGLAGTILVEKLTGAFVTRFAGQHNLADAYKVADISRNALVTIGSSIDHCKVPGRKFESELGENSMELGMGIHNEPGAHVLTPIPATEDLIENQMLPKLLDPSDKDRYFVPFEKDDEVVLLVNNLGGVSNLIMSSIAAITTDLLKKKYGIVPKQTITGCLMTSFNMDGFSITLMNVSKISKEMKAAFPDKEIDVMQLLRDPTDAPGWPISSYELPPTVDHELLKDEEIPHGVGHYDFDSFAKWMKGAAANVEKEEPRITQLDTLVGDGDCGYTLLAGCKGITDNLDKISKTHLSSAMDKISEYVEASMGGTSGGLYSILISGFVHGLQATCKDSSEKVTPEVLAESFQIALDTLYHYTNARPGASTMIDALVPFIDEFAKTHDFKKAVEAADKGAQSTADIVAEFGRASYVENSQGIPDPGAVGLVAFLKGVEGTMQ